MKKKWIIVAIVLYILISIMILFIYKGEAATKIATISAAQAQVSLHQSLMLDCEWDGNTSGITAMAYYLESGTTSTYIVETAVPKYTPSGKYLIVDLTSEMLSMDGNPLSRIEIFYTTAPDRC